jgi:hypothetical protein
MNIATRKLLVTALLCSAAAAPALAQSSRLYGAVDYGTASISGYSATSPGALTASAGYRYLPNLNFEAGITQFGSATAVAPGTGRVSINETMVSATAVGILPINRDVDLFGKLGIGLHNNEVRGLPDDLVFGFGGQVKITPQFSLRLQYESLGRIKIPTTNERTDISRLSFGAVVNF